jgi:hypothetical protein
MATKFIKATNKKLQHTSKLHDIDSPLALFKELKTLNEKNGHTMKDWEFTVHDYKGDELGKYDWKKEVVSVRLGDLFS